MRQLALSRAIPHGAALGAPLKRRPVPFPFPFPGGSRTTLAATDPADGADNTIAAPLHAIAPGPRTPAPHQPLVLVPNGRPAAEQGQGQPVRLAALPAGAAAAAAGGPRPLARPRGLHRPRPEPLGYPRDDGLEPARPGEKIGKEIGRLLSDPSRRLDEELEPGGTQPDLVLLGDRAGRPREQRRRDEEEAEGEVGGDGGRSVERRVGLEAGGERRDGAEVDPQLGVGGLQGADGTRPGAMGCGVLDGGLGDVGTSCLRERETRVMTTKISSACFWKHETRW